MLSKFATHGVLASAVLLLSCTLINQPAPRPDRGPSDQSGYQRYVSSAPQHFQSHSTTFYKDIPYDSGTSQHVDLLIPNGKGPFPVLIYFHGGGFKAGKKEVLYKQSGKKKKDVFFDAALDALKNGIAVASADYTLLKHTGNEGVISALHDGQRVVKFLKYHAKEFNLDPNSVAVSGSSAGGGIALWLATTEENVQVDQNGDSDAYLSASPDVVCAAAYNSQATYDISKWFDVVFKEYDVSESDMVVGDEEDRVEAVYNISSMDQVNDPQIVNYRSRVDVLHLLDAGDPPIWMGSPRRTAPKPESFKAMLHHPAHVLALKTRSDELGLSTKNQFHAIPYDFKAEQSLTDFLIDHLTR